MESPFSDDHTLRAQYDRRSFLKRRIDLVISLFKQLAYAITVLVHRLCRIPHRCGQKMKWKTGSEGLIVLLHGLFNDPAAWYAQLTILQKHATIDIFAPIVPKRGVCSLEEAAQPILPTLVDYAKTHPGKPFCLIGVSNGSRIAMWLETKLRDAAPLSPVFVSTIAGIHFGSSRIDLLDNWGIARYLSPKELREELKYGSVKARALLEEVKAPLPLGCAPRGYEFYASTEDLSIPEMDSSLPKLGKGEQFYVLHGESHESIVAAVAAQQIESCLQWVRRYSKKS